MKKMALLFALYLFFQMSVFSQDSIPTTDTVPIQVVTDSQQGELLNADTLITESVASLLPKHYLPTQRLLWGQKGLMRHFDSFKLSEEGRDHELEIRDKMLTAHRYLGYATLAGMLAQGVVGERLYQGHTGLKGLHEGLAGAVNIGYFTSASMALFAPPRAKDRAPGFSKVKLHKYLSIVHLSSMIATNILSGMTENNSDLKTLHRATAYTAFGSFFASMVVISF
jgi:hypothetical protein